MIFINKFLTRNNLLHPMIFIKKFLTRNILLHHLLNNICRFYLTLTNFLLGIFYYIQSFWLTNFLLGTFYYIQSFWLTNFLLGTPNYTTRQMLTVDFTWPNKFLTQDTTLHCPAKAPPGKSPIIIYC